MTPSLDILPPAQRAFWEEAKNLPTGFVLYGGTAVALQLAHRQSVDFYFFSTPAFQSKDLLASLPFAATAEILQEGPDTLTLRIDRGGPVILSYFGNLSFGQLRPPAVADNGMKIASLPDLLATKLKTVFQRAEAKDYLDIAALLRAGLSLAEGLAGARALFGENFNPALPLKALTYFGDGDVETVPEDERARLISAVKETRELPRVSLHSPLIGSAA